MTVEKPVENDRREFGLDRGAGVTSQVVGDLGHDHPRDETQWLGPRQRRHRRAGGRSFRRPLELLRQPSQARLLSSKRAPSGVVAAMPS